MSRALLARHVVCYVDVMVVVAVVVFVVAVVVVVVAVVVATRTPAIRTHSCPAGLSNRPLVVLALPSRPPRTMRTWGVRKGYTSVQTTPLLRTYGPRGAGTPP